MVNVNDSSWWHSKVREAVRLLGATHGGTYSRTK